MQESCIKYACRGAKRMKNQEKELKNISGVCLYKDYFSMHLKSIMGYKSSFFMSVMGQFLTSFNAFLGIYFMFSRFHSVKGFKYEEVLLSFGIILMSFSLAECFVRGFDSFSTIVRNGEFDRIMVRPRNEILQVLGSRIEFSRIGRMVQAICILIYAIICSGLQWNLVKVITLLGMLVGGVAVFSGIFLVYAALCFFTLEGLEFINIFTDGAREFGGYPMSIYGKRILQVCTFVIPYALVQYYPLLYLLDRGKWWYCILPYATCIFIIPCFIFWKIGVKHYQSNGS